MRNEELKVTGYNPFFDDLKDRKAPVASAAHKKNGSKSKKCSLPSDNLTPAQQRKLNGPVQSYELHKFMPYTEFKKMPTDLQQAHLDYIQRRFRLGAGTISKHVFGLSSSALPLHMKQAKLELASYRGKAISEETMEAITAWKSGKEEVVRVEEPVVVVDAEPLTNEPAPETCATPFVVKNLTLDISGPADDLLRYISVMLGGRIADVRIEINFKENDK